MMIMNIGECTVKEDIRKIICSRVCSAASVMEVV